MSKNEASDGVAGGPATSGPAASGQTVGGSVAGSGATTAGSGRPRGFAAMDPARQRELASRGGQAAHAKGRGHEWTQAEARAAGARGGKVSRGGRGKLLPGEPAVAARVVCPEAHETDKASCTLDANHPGPNHRDASGRTWFRYTEASKPRPIGTL